MNSDQRHLRLCTRALPRNLRQGPPSPVPEEDYTRPANVMRSCVSAAKTIRIIAKLISHLFLIDSCGSLAVARTVLTGGLNARSDPTCTSSIFNSPLWKSC